VEKITEKYAILKKELDSMEDLESRNKNEIKRLVQMNNHIRIVRGIIRAEFNKIESKYKLNENKNKRAD
jgi:hypothetical protein